LNKIRAAVVGCGSIHVQHVEAIQRLDDAVLAAVVDTNNIKGQDNAGKYDCIYYPDYQEMLSKSDIDVIHICTPHYQHKEMIIAALQAGKDVFCEKPVVLNRQEIAEVAAVQSQSGKTVGVCYQNRFNNTTQALLNCLHNNELGEIKGVRAFLTWDRQAPYYTQSGWRGRMATEGGSLLINQAIHTLDLMQLICGGVEKLKSKIDTAFLSSVIDTEDSAMIAMQMKNGARGLFYGSNGYTHNAPVFLEVHGDKGFATLNNGELTIISDKKNETIKDDFKTNTGEKVYWGKSHYKAVQNFYDFLRDNKNGTLISLQEAYQSLNIVECAYQSAKINDWVILPEM